MGVGQLDAENTRFAEIIDGWNAANPDTQVQLNLVPDYDTKLQTALAGGSLFDIFYIDSLCRSTSRGRRQRRRPHRRPAGQPRGLLPQHARSLHHRRHLLPPAERLQHASPSSTIRTTPPMSHTPPMTGRTRAAAEQLTDADAAGTYGMVLAPTARLIAFIYQAGGTITDEGFTTMTLDTDAVKQATEFFNNMKVDGFVAQPADLDSGHGEAFGKGRAATLWKATGSFPSSPTSSPMSITASSNCSPVCRQVHHGLHRLLRRARQWSKQREGHPGCGLLDRP